MRCVLMTAFGVPVEPDVNSSRATVSRVIDAKALATAASVAEPVACSSRVVANALSWGLWNTTAAPGAAR